MTQWKCRVILSSVLKKISEKIHSLVMLESKRSAGEQWITKIYEILLMKHTNKGIHPSFEAQNRPHQKVETCVSVALKRLMSWRLKSKLTKEAEHVEPSQTALVRRPPYRVVTFCSETVNTAMYVMTMPTPRKGHLYWSKSESETTSLPDRFIGKRI